MRPTGAPGSQLFGRVSGGGGSRRVRGPEGLQTSDGVVGPADFRRRFLALLSYQFSAFSPPLALNILQNRNIGKPTQPGELVGQRQGWWRLVVRDGRWPGVWSRERAELGLGLGLGVWEGGCSKPVSPRGSSVGPRSASATPSPTVPFIFMTRLGGCDLALEVSTQPYSWSVIEPDLSPV